MKTDRRTVLKTTAALTGLLPLSLRQALAAPMRKGSIKDVEHVVILMQENRSFDHYFGTLRGVRGYGDPRTPKLPGGKPVWFQPTASHADGYIAPFHINTAETNSQCLESLDHSWKQSQATWQHHDAWIAKKGPMTMGHFTRADIPFYHALADAFTICDAYHCSIFGPTNPNRLFLFTGTNGLSIGQDGLQAVENPPEETNEFADPAHDDPRFKPFTWPTYAERLQKAGIDWRVYQEYDNYGDNGLSYFAQFRGDAAKTDLGKRARSWPKSSNKENAKQSRGEHLIGDFAVDVAADRLPQVSWIVAPYIMCEHPTAPPGYGEVFVSGLLSVLAANPKVWAKTAFIINYDENDGFFDHVPPPVPSVAPGQGESTVAVTGEVYKGEPVGLGPRVPMLVVSPWTRGGWVNSELFDHTSIIRFLETRFGVMEPNISPWRRAVCGDLTSVFDFAGADDAYVALPKTGAVMATVDASCKLQHPVVPAAQSVPVQEAGQRRARALPYDIHVSGTPGGKSFQLNIENKSRTGVALAVYADGAGPWHYTVGAGEKLSDALPVADGRYGFSVHGPNGFLREFHGDSSVALETSARHESGSLVLTLANRGDVAISVTTAANDYSEEAPRTLTVAPGATVEDRWDVASSAHWYDVSVTSGTTYSRRFAGHFETGRPSLSDPAFGKAG
ncbi:MAG TPA: phospholipase C, phosphocholine-specific [Rhizomicrobium sp.]|jgi:phospholipase C